MIHTVNINDYSDVEIQFNESTINSIIQQFVKKFSKRYRRKKKT